MKIVIALGGNALGNNPQQQKEILKESVKPIVDLIQEGHQLIITHGNGPQVGMILNKMDDLPMVEANAMTQGYIGHHLQNALQNELNSRSIKKPVITLITQVIVDEQDTAFDNPTKPIGQFMSKEEAQTLKETKNYHIVEDSGRVYRRVVPSPKPIDIVELESIISLSHHGHIVITVGGGGIPTLKSLEGIDAVIDKDHASALLADKVNADLLIILTAVEQVSINYNHPNQKELNRLSLEDCKKYIQEGHFAPGSMLPKIEAAIAFVEHSNKEALITSLEKASEGIKGLTGTRITKE